MRQARVWFAAALVVVGFVALCANGGIPSHGGEIRLLALLGGAVSVFTALTVWRTVRELAFERRLAAVSSPGDVGGFSVRWVEADAPFVAGLLWPAIYWPVDFAEGLTARERSSVLLHEEHHRRHRAPRRLLLLGVLQSRAGDPCVRGVAARSARDRRRPGGPRCRRDTELTRVRTTEALAGVPRSPIVERCIHRRGRSPDPQPARRPCVQH